MHNDKDIPSASPSSGELLNELGSLRELLDEELSVSTPQATSLEEIGSVGEYLRLKQNADSAGISIEDYLAQQDKAAGVENELELLEDDVDSHPEAEEVLALDEEEEKHPDDDNLLMALAEEEKRSPAPSTATTVEEYFAAVVAAKHRQKPPTATTTVFRKDSGPKAAGIVAKKESPLPDEVASTNDDIPVLEEVAPEGEAQTSRHGVSVEEMQELVDFIVNRKLQHLKPELEKEVMAELQKLLPISALSDA